MKVLYEIIVIDKEIAKQFVEANPVKCSKGVNLLNV